MEECCPLDLSHRGGRAARERTRLMSENNNNNNSTIFANDRDDALWATAVKSAKLANTYGLKTTTVLARLAASRVMSGEDVGILATMVAEDADMRAAGVKASSIRAYGAPLKRLATVLSADVYEALLMGDKAVGVSAADKWVRDAGAVSAKIDKSLAGHEINRVEIASRMMELIPSPTKDKGAGDKGAEDKGAGDKGVSYGDALEVLVDAAQVLLNMTTRGELTESERRMMMRNVARIHAAFDAACAVAVGK